MYGHVCRGLASPPIQNVRLIAPLLDGIVSSPSEKERSAYQFQIANAAIPPDACLQNHRPLQASADGLLRIARLDFLQQQLLRKLFRKTYRLERSKKRRPGVRQYIVQSGADRLAAARALSMC